MHTDVLSGGERNAVMFARGLPRSTARGSMPISTAISIARRKLGRCGTSAKRSVGNSVGLGMGSKATSSFRSNKRVRGSFSKSCSAVCRSD